MEFSRTLKLRELGADGGQAFAIAASASECAAVAHRLDLVEVAEIVFSGRLDAGPRDGVVILRALLTAKATQRCVVTLQPVAADLVVPVERYFVRDGHEVETDVFVSPEDEEPEPIEGEVLDLGEIAVEELSLALDPYPRADDAEAAVAAFNAAEEERARNAFAALAALRGRREQE